MEGFAMVEEAIEAIYEILIDVIEGVDVSSQYDDWRGMMKEVNDIIWRRTKWMRLEMWCVFTIDSVLRLESGVNSIGWVLSL